ncbi:GNAT family N-acetyltransferase [Terasakiella sp. A23]|uniref:GNAT family N-acetyltransferase n=1 Tax=Terasakiella sp. FCG-A23 TaxID=3080561 RepID=UPI0029543EAE|nr:GNAT family N-acetyltransferase [Terasakiella sp. A23]MDV7338119.1 GNAT family N-acetyltransferase [Terasakiella sp. A23]
MTIVELYPIHAKIIAKLHKDSFDENWTAKAFADLIGLPASFGFIMMQEDEPVGFILCQGDECESEIITISTNPSARRQGIARNLLNAALKKTEKIFLEVAKDNSIARLFYTEAGFSKVGVRKNYYKRADNSTIDAIVMEKMRN